MTGKVAQPVIRALGRRKQENCHEFKASLGYTISKNQRQHDIKVEVSEVDSRMMATEERGER